MKKTIKTYLFSLLFFLVVDGLWLGLLARDFYNSQIGFLLSKDINWLAAVVFYLLFVLGIVVFAVIPYVKQGPWYKAALKGMLFGLIAYATYDLTNLATIEGWPVLVTVVDLIWGSFISGLTATAGFFFCNVHRLNHGQ